MNGSDLSMWLGIAGTLTKYGIPGLVILGALICGYVGILVASKVGGAKKEQQQNEAQAGAAAATQSTLSGQQSQDLIDEENKFFGKKPPK